MSIGRTYLEYLDEDEEDFEDTQPTQPLPPSPPGPTNPTNPTTPVSPNTSPDDHTDTKDDTGPKGVEIKTTEEDETANIQKNDTMPMFFLFGERVDRDSAIVIYLIIFIWIAIWKTTQLYKILRYDKTFLIIFFMFILYMLININTSGTTSGGVIYELNILLTVEQMVSILFGTMVLFALFQDRLPVHENCRYIIQRIMIAIVIILGVASLWINVITSGKAFRAIRKFKQGIYNIALTLFIIVCLIFIKGSQCPK